MKRMTKIALGLACLIGLHGAQAADLAAGKQLAAGTCASCHGADGNSTDPQYPRLAGQRASYLKQAMMDYKSGGRQNPIMSGFAAGLSEDDMGNLAAFFASQKGLRTATQPMTVD